MDILITGTGRCGTGYISQVLTSAGVPCTHEQVFTTRGWDFALECIRLRKEHPEWGWLAESSWLAVPFLDRPELVDMRVVHLVRHPKAVMDSNLKLRYFSGSLYETNFMRPYLPELDDWPLPEHKAACWYLRMNELCEARADVFHRVEDDPRLLLDKLGIDHAGKPIYANTSYNTRPGIPSDVDLDTLPDRLRDRLFEMTMRYGYDWPVMEKRIDDKPERWMVSPFDNTFFGIPTLQSWADLLVWERFLRGRELGSIVELGTHRGGLSVFLALHAAGQGLEFRTYDKAPMPTYQAAQRVGLASHFTRCDLFGEFELPDLPRPMVLLCDNGNKPQELLTFAPRLIPGDYVAVHDWGTEIGPWDTAKVEHLLEPVFHQECERVGSITRFWRRV